MGRARARLLGGLVLLICTTVYVVALATFASVGAETPHQTSSTLVLLAAFFAYPVMGALIVTQRPSNTVGWIFCAIGLGTATTSFTAGYVQHALAIHADAQLATGLIDAVGNGVWPLNMGLGSLLLFLFPDGKLLSPRWRVVFWVDVVAMAAVTLAGLLQPGPLESSGRVVNPIGLTVAGPLLAALAAVGQAIFPLLVLSAIASVIVRYRRAAGVQRQQIKWFAYSAALMALIIATTVFAAPAFTPSGQDPANTLLSNAGFALGFVMLPIGAGIGVLRFRLYDIDILINRTLVYGSLTAILAAVYFGVVIGTQAAIQAVTGQTTAPPVALVGSTLLIAALFQPMRYRIQTGIDHRFYRRKYDAAKTLEAFSATLRTETDLEQLREHVQVVVEETMQPAHISLWLRDPTRAREPEKGGLV